MKKIAIMQPTYLPWAGYFSLMNNVDTFVFLDSVQFERRSWQQRNRIRTKEGERFLTIPVKSKGLRDQLINEVEVDKSSNYKNQHLSLIKQNYSKSKYFKDNFEEIFNNSFYDEIFLSKITTNFILKLRTILEIKTIIFKSSEMNIKGKKDVLLASICKELGFKEYIAPQGSKNYLENSKAFANNEIKISYFKYQHPVYQQINNIFIPQLSIIDMIFNCGKEKTIDFLKTNN